MKFIAAQCKLCRKPIRLQLEDAHQPPDFFLQMVTCSKCIEMVDTRRKAIDTITAGMSAHFRAKEDKELAKKPAARSEAMQKARQMLTDGTKSLAMVTAEFYGKPGELVWTPRIVDALLSHDDGGWWKELTHYREVIKEKLTCKSIPGPVMPHTIQGESQDHSDVGVVREKVAQQADDDDAIDEP